MDPDESLMEIQNTLKLHRWKVDVWEIIQFVINIILKKNKISTISNMT